ncbi:MULTISPECIES: hypothetical protein [unclassified Roseofilum]|uniref:hypothetical protein n=1 Tax=unclassified Roseofilum TaxID=2620099 RepID=UPI001B058E7F|nr:MULTISPECIES: hypothetical protein [unclassified Roseofilum]MBP0006844.1 hypothetical protein [Roseofilum sp. Belize Diploria]MBP0035403.1 hypothetical protein [Roseofilum sp. Belize BBD 4]
MKKISMKIFADYHIIFLSDANNNDDISGYISDHSIKDKLVYTSSKIAIVTARNMEVPVGLGISEKNIPVSLDSWDHIVQCSIMIHSGKLAVFGAVDYQPDTLQIPVNPGIYQVTVLYGGLDTISKDGLEGEDFYKILLYPTDKLEGTKILKQTVG